MIELNREIILRADTVGIEAIRLWGINAQLVKTMEECGELIQQCAKIVNGNPNFKPEDIQDEIADVLFMVIQLRREFCFPAIDARLDYKVTRTEAAIKKHHDRAAEYARKIREQISRPRD